MPPAPAASLTLPDADALTPFVPPTTGSGQPTRRVGYVGDDVFEHCAAP
jgi:hypothetical protein